VYVDAKMKLDRRMVANLLAVDMTSNAVALKHSRLPFDADASATPARQLLSNHVIPDGDSLGCRV